MKFQAFLILFLTLSCSNSDKNSKICIYTGLGDIYADIFLDNAQTTSSNFLEYINKNLYDSCYFYRSVKPGNQSNNKIKIAVIQGGFENDLSLKMLPPIPHESTEKSGIHHLNGTLSMARNDTGTATSEFFICIGEQPELDYGGKRNPDGQGFAAFGRVYKGMEIVKKIHSMKDTNQYLVNRVFIDSIRIIR